MQQNRKLLIVLAVMALAIAGLIGFYVFLTGGNAGQPDSGAAKSASATGLVPVRSIYLYGSGKNLVRPTGLGSDDRGNIFATLIDSAQIVQFDRNGDFVTSWGKRGSAPGELLSPIAVAADRLARHVYVIDRSRLRLIAFDLEGTYLWELPMLNPLAVTVAPNGEVLVATFGPIARFSSEGQLLGQVGDRGSASGQFDYPRALVSDSSGSVFIADTNNNRVVRAKLTGDATASVTWVLGQAPTGQDDPNVRFGLPSGIALDEKGRVVVLDSFNHTFELLDPGSSKSMTDFGGERRGSTDGEFNLPTQVVSLGGDLFAVSDTYNDRIQIIRLLAPGERQPWRVNPWVKWALLLPLLLLIPLFGRKRHYLTDDVVTTAVQDGNARLLIGAVRSPRVLVETAERLGNAAEEGTLLREYLVTVSGTGDTPDERLLTSARRTLLEKLLLRRHVIVCADDEECAKATGSGFGTLTYAQVKAEFSLKG